ncbi:unnamed protein product [Paramecium pentaurelia]|uniref:Uncharacterized protein n=1 Tax=Paramecium pentaurelia TaxID=43138 RepID=A0A8S1V1Y4_9CILI|nr:unnamed protein product [Paramecium pentaurelia]
MDFEEQEDEQMNDNLFNIQKEEDLKIEYQQLQQNDYENKTGSKLLQKNKEYQKSLLQYKQYLERKIAKKQQQIQQLDQILQTIPKQEEEINFKEKCSAYLTLEILHDSKQRKIFSYAVNDFEMLKQENPPHYVKLIQDLKKKDLKLKKLDYTSPRFRQQCKKKQKQHILTQAIQPKNTQIRELIIKEVVNCLPIEGNEIQWSLLPIHATQLLNIYTSDQNSIEAIEIYRVWLKRYHQLYNNQFTLQEDNKLVELVQMIGDNQWAYLAKLITTKTSIQLRERWFKFLNKNIKRQRWKILEDLKLIILVDYFGVGQWNKLHQFFKNRTEVQIRERWCNVLDPELEIRPWTEEEDQELLSLNQKYGNAWSVVSLKLKRTDNECRRRFQQIKK